MTRVLNERDTVGTTRISCNVYDIKMYAISRMLYAQWKGPFHNFETAKERNFNRVLTLPSQTYDVQEASPTKHGYQLEPWCPNDGEMVSK